MDDHPYYLGRAAYALLERDNPFPPTDQFNHAQWNLGLVTMGVDSRDPAYRLGRELGLQADCPYPRGSLEHTLFMHGQLDSSNSPKSH
jgi:hypothetical protein